MNIADIGCIEGVCWLDLDLFPFLVLVERSRGAVRIEIHRGEPSRSANPTWRGVLSASR